MRRRIRFRLVGLNAGLLSLLLVGCLGHLIEKSQGTTSSAGGTFSGGGNTGTDCTVPPLDKSALVQVPAPSTTNATGTGECPAATMPNDPTRPGYGAQRDPGVADLLQSMSQGDKVKQLYGIPTPEPQHNYDDIEEGEDVPSAPGSTTMVRGWKFRDADRGVNLDAVQASSSWTTNGRPSQGKNYATAFPVASARAASWDTILEMQVGEAMGEEVMTSKNNMLLAPCMNIIRHPYWGRVQETYGEDMYHVGRMATALVAGIQKHVAACAKHYAANNIENGRANQDVQMSEQTLREAFTRHFEMVVQDGGVACIMAAYNLINDTKCTQNGHLLTDILRGDYAFRGMVLSDWWAMPGDQTDPDNATARSRAVEALQAGLDMEVPWGLNMPQIAAALGNEVTSAELDTTVGRLLEQKFRFQTAYTNQGYGVCKGTATVNGQTLTQTALTGDSITNNDDPKYVSGPVINHLQLAEEAEIRSAVLLSNGAGGTPVLPIGSGVSSIAVVGLDEEFFSRNQETTAPASGGTMHFATDVNIGDRGSSRVNADPDKSVGPYAGIQTWATKHNIANVTSGNSVDAANGADLVVVVVGLTAADEGEEYALVSGGDRTSLTLPYNQEAFVNSVLGLNKPTVIIIESGSIVNVPWINSTNQATIWAGYGGERQGNAFGQLLFGDRNFSGKMAVSWPQQTDLDNYLQFRSATGNTTQEDYFFGYRFWDNNPNVQLVFPFGWGMSYTKFQYSNLQVPCGSISKTGVVKDITVDVANTGTVDGDEVVMMFVEGPPKPAGITGERPVKELKGFQRVSLKAAGSSGGTDTARVTLPINVQDLRHWEGDASGKWVIDEGDYKIWVGPNARDLTLNGTIHVHS